MIRSLIGNLRSTYINKTEDDIKSNNNNNNKNDRLIYLPHILLYKIINYLNSNLDRISFSIVSKKLYEDRNKYLEFNDNNIAIRHLIRHPINYNEIIHTQHNYDHNRDKFTSNLKSYQQQIDKIVNTKSITILFEGESISSELSFDYNVKYPKKISGLLNLYNDRVVKIIYSSRSQINGGYNLKDLTDEILGTNVRSLHIITYFIFKYISATDLSAITELYLDELTPCELHTGHLPPNLEVLTLGYSFHPITNLATLPITLRYLKLNMAYNQPIISFPPNLKELHFPNYGTRPYSFEIKSNQIPTTLHTLCNVCRISGMVNNISLTRLGLHIPHDEGVPELPPTLTDLNISLSESIILQHGTKFIPPTVKRLSICSLSYIHPVNQISKLYSIKSLLLAPEYSQVKKLQIKSMSYIHFNEDSIPTTVETLDINLVEMVRCFQVGVIPNSVKSLKLPMKMDGDLLASSIPSSVEKLYIRQWENRLTPDMLPPTVKSISITPTFFTNRKFRSNSICKSLPLTISFIKIKTDFVDFNLKRLDENYFLIIEGHKKYTSLKGGIKHVNFLDKYFKQNLNFVSYRHKQ